MPRADVVLVHDVVLVQRREDLAEQRLARRLCAVVLSPPHMRAWYNASPTVWTHLQHLDGLHRVHAANAVDEPAPARNERADLAALRGGVGGHERDALDDRGDDGLAHAAQRHVARHAQRLELDGRVVDRVPLRERALERLRALRLELALGRRARERAERRRRRRGRARRRGAARRARERRERRRVGLRVGRIVRVVVREVAREQVRGGVACGSGSAGGGAEREAGARAYAHEPLVAVPLDLVHLVVVFRRARWPDDRIRALAEDRRVVALICAPSVGVGPGHNHGRRTLLDLLPLLVALLVVRLARAARHPRKRAEARVLAEHDAVADEAPALDAAALADARAGANDALLDDGVRAHGRVVKHVRVRDVGVRPDRAALPDDARRDDRAGGHGRVRADERAPVDLACPVKRQMRFSGRAAA